MVTHRQPRAQGESPADAVALRSYAGELADALEVALPAWVEASIMSAAARAGHEVDDGMVQEARDAGARAGREVGPRLRSLLLADIDDQRTTPLEVLRRSTGYATEVLHNAGVPHPARDQFAVDAFPDDVFGLAPATFADLSPALLDLGVRWGAAKAHVHLARRRAEGRR